MTGPYLLHMAARRTWQQCSGLAAPAIPGGPLLPCTNEGSQDGCGCVTGTCSGCRGMLEAQPPPPPPLQAAGIAFVIGNVLKIASCS